MTRWARAWVLALAAVALGCASASAATSPGLGFPFGTSLLGVTHVSEVDTQLRVSGGVAVSFHSDPAGGCARLAGCAYAGTITAQFSDGQLTVLSYRDHGRTQRAPLLALGAFGGPPQSDVVYARVTRTAPGAPGGVCADSAPTGGSLSSTHAGSRFTFDLAGALVPLRCAGPQPADLAGALPSIVLTLPAARGTRIDLHGTRAFAAHGFAGTVSSTLVITVGRSAHVTTSYPPGTRLHREREVLRTFTVTSERGAFALDVRGTADAGVCILLDSCGLTGTLTLSPGLAGSQGELVTSAPASRPIDQLLAVLSGASGAAVRGLAVSGFFAGGAATLLERVHQGTTCTDTTSIGPGLLSFVESHGQLRGSYGPQVYPFIGPDAAHTRCPGPELPIGVSLAAGSVPQSALARHALTLALSASGRFGDDGYSVAARGRVTLTLRPGRVRSQVVLLPGG